MWWRDAPPYPSFDDVSSGVNIAAYRTSNFRPAMFNRLRILLCVATATLIVLVSAPVHADTEGGTAWGLMATELSTAGVFALNFGVKSWPNQGPAQWLNMAPLVIGPGIGFAAHKLELSPQSAYAVHGSAVIGFNMLLVGMLIDGRSERDGLRVGNTTWALGAAGVAAGGWAGATQFEGEAGTVFMLAPVGGFIAGGVIGLVGGLFASQGGGDAAFKGAVIGAAAGMAIGIATSFVYAQSTSDSQGGTAAREASNDREADTRPVMFSVGGAF